MLVSLGMTGLGRWPTTRTLVTQEQATMGVMLLLAAVLAVVAVAMGIALFSGPRPSPP